MVITVMNLMTGWTTADGTLARPATSSIVDDVARTSSKSDVKRKTLFRYIVRLCVTAML